MNKLIAIEHLQAKQLISFRTRSIDTDIQKWKVTQQVRVKHLRQLINNCSELVPPNVNVYFPSQFNLFLFLYDHPLPFHAEVVGPGDVSTDREILLYMFIERMILVWAYECQTRDANYKGELRSPR